MRPLGDAVLTHCPYCALNCGIGLEVGPDARLTGQVRWKGSPLTAGAVCSKGSTAWEQVHHADRVTITNGRNTYVLANFPDMRLVGKILQSDRR